MKVTKSQQHIKIDWNKHQGFFSNKKWNDLKFVDHQEDPFKPYKDNNISNEYNPKVKLSLSALDKAELVVEERRKIGSSLKRDWKRKCSLEKLNKLSALPPIGQESKDLEELLRKIKIELNGYVIKNTKMAKEIEKIKINSDQLRERQKMIESILNEKGEKLGGEISDKIQTSAENKYNNEVLKQMRDRLKSEIVFESKRNYNFEELLKSVNMMEKSIDLQMSNQELSLTNSQTARKNISTSLTSETDDFKAKLGLAEKQFVSQALKSTKHPEKVMELSEDEYRYNANLSAHFSLLKKLRAHLVVSGIYSALHHKNEVKYINFERAYYLILMYSRLNKHEQNERSWVFDKKQNLKITFTNKIMGMGKSTENESLVDLFEECFETKKELQSKIKKLEEKIEELERKNTTLSEAWLSGMVTENIKENSTKLQADNSKELLLQVRSCQEKEVKLLRINEWIKKQASRLNIMIANEEKSEKVFELVCRKLNDWSNKL